MNPHGDMDAYISRFWAMERPSYLDSLVNSINISDKATVRPSGLSLIGQLVSTAAAILRYRPHADQQKPIGAARAEYR